MELSGLAASVSGAMMHLRIEGGIYFEVGGASTNPAAIRDGQPPVAHARVGCHETFVNSVDIRALGIRFRSLMGWRVYSEISK